VRAVTPAQGIALLCANRMIEWLKARLIVSSFVSSDCPEWNASPPSSRIAAEWPGPTHHLIYDRFLSPAQRRLNVSRR